jgi:hypothetical protein
VKRAALTVLVLAALSPAWGQTTLDVVPDGPVPIRTAIGGFNVSNAMLLLKVKDKVATLAPSTYTWPAGNVGDEYPLNRAALEYLRLQQKFVPAGIWFNQFNLFQGTLEQAIEQVRVARESGVRTDVWTIGNEPDLYGPNRGDKSWTAQKYAAVYRQWATALKAAYPGIKLSGPAISQPKDDWMKVFLAECGDLVDVVSWHWYPTNAKATDAQALATSRDVGPMVAKYRAWVTDNAYNPLGYKNPIETALTEFAVHWDTNNETQINDIIGACWTADVLGRLAESGLNYSHFFCLQEYGGHAIFTSGNKPRVGYWVFDFYKSFADAVRLVRTQPTGSPKAELVATHGWIDAAGVVTLIVTNQGDLPVPGFTLRVSGGSYRVRESRQLTDTTPVPLSWKGLTADLPGHSVTVVTLEPAS